MLVLTRRVGEEIVINGIIHVTVLAVKGSRVRLGFTTPSSIPVVRQELVARSGGSPTLCPSLDGEAPLGGRSS